MPNYRALLTRLHTSNLLAWEDMDPVTAREVREALDDEPATDGLDLTPILHRWGPGPLWEVCTEDGDVDGYVRALCYEDARQAAVDMGCDGDYTVAECHEAPPAERLEHAVNDIAALLTEVTRLRLLASTPSPAPSPSAHQCPNCGAGSPEVCGHTNEWWLECGRCSYTSRNYLTEEDAVFGGFRCSAGSTPSPAPTDSGAEPARGEAVSARACWDCAHSRDDHRRCVAAVAATCAAWIGENSDDQNEWRPLPGARNCPGWAPREVSNAE